MVTEIIHANIVVRDVERSVKFYTELLGARIIRDWWGEGETTGIAMGFDRPAKWHAYMLRWGEGDEYAFPQIDLLQWLEPESVGEPYPVLNHIGIARVAFMVEDIGPICERLKAAGVEFISEPVPMNPKTERGSRTFVVMLKDPDGIFIELVGPSKQNPM
jgi:lactoylglutathione lyase